MNDLARQQGALLDAIFVRPGASTEVPRPGPAALLFVGDRGLRAYRANATVLAQRTLRSAYPVVAQLIGDEDFDRMATDFWHRHPPRRGDLAQWGAALPEFLHANPLLADEPYLGDVAAIEWALHGAALATDQAADVASFACLSADGGLDHVLRLASGTALVHSQFPIASIALAHLVGEPSLAEAGEKLRNQVAETALVWRQGMRPRLRLCSPGETGLLEALIRGEALGSALEAAHGMDFGDWLRQAVQDGLVLGVQGAVRPGPTAPAAASP